MKRVVVIIFALTALAAFSAKAATVFVKMTRFATFDPKDITINQGDTVTWTNTFSLQHDSVSFDGFWRSPLLGNKGTYSFKFDLPAGRYDYFCTPHLSIGMVGSVTVVAPVNNPPTASITSPGNGATFQLSDTINVVVAANDDVAVAKVDLLVDGAVFATSSAAPFQFSISLPAGPHQLSARATDGPGLTGTSSVVNITVQAPNQPPVVLIKPLAGGAFTAPANLSIEADASDDVGIDHVEFFVNGVSVGLDSTAPYSITQTFAAGSYRLTAKAFDVGGLTATSDEVTIEVKEPLPLFPTIAVVNPVAEQYVNTNVVLVAEAADADGFVASVGFFLSTNSLGTATPVAGTSRFELATILPEGRQTISATATDNQGHATAASPVSFTVVRPIVLTSAAKLPSGVMRVSAFGTSGVLYVFEYSEDGGTTWAPLLTNVLHRRIFFFDDTNAVDRPMRIYRPTVPSR